MKSRIVLVLLVITSLLMGCPFDGTDTGAIELRLSAMTARTLQPDVDMTIATYDVTGQGPGGAEFDVTISGGTTTRVDALVPGSWQISVAARNAAAQVIGTGSASATIAAATTTTVEVTVRQLEGLGTLDLTISWPEGELTNPSVIATLAPGLADPGTELDFTVDTTSASYRNEALEPGYYFLSLTLNEDATPVWPAGGGDVWAVRIIAGETTDAVFALTAEDLDPGGVAVEITPDLQNPFLVTFQGEHQALVPGTSMTVTGLTDPPTSSPAYQWYLSGSPILGETTETIMIGDGLAEGNYSLTLLVQTDDILSSSGFAFAVSEYARAPVFFVSGHNTSPAVFDTLVVYLEDQGYPSQWLRTIDLSPRDGANIPAAEDQIAPAIELFLADVNNHIDANRPGLPHKTRVDLVSYSMGGLSTRWYAARVRPDRVRSWLSLAGANHGTDAAYFADRTDGGSLDLYPAYAANEVDSYIQYQLNGEPFVADVDETPYGIGVDASGVVTVPPDETRSIFYTTISPTTDSWVIPIASVQVDGAGGIAVPIPGDLPATVLSPGNFQLTNGITHDSILTNTSSLRLVAIILGLVH